jgi:hypothetical protein
MIKLNKIIKPFNSNKFIFIIRRNVTSNKNNSQYNNTSYLTDHCQNNYSKKNCSNNEKCKKKLDDD